MSAALWTVSGASIYYSQEARAYSLMALATTVNLLFCVRCMKNPKKWTNWLVLLIASLSSSYLHYMGFLFSGLCIGAFAAIGLWRREWKTGGLFLLVVFVTLNIYAPWLRALAIDAPLVSMVKSYNVTPNLSIYRWRMMKFAFSYETYWLSQPSLLSPKTVDGVSGAILVVALFGGVYSLWKQKKRSFHLFVLSGLVLFTLMSVYLKDLSSDTRVFYERYFFFLLPLMYMIVSELVVSISKPAFRYGVMVLLFSLMLFQPLINQNYYGSIQKTEYRQLSQMLRGLEAGPVFSQCGDPSVFEHYLGQPVKPLPTRLELAKLKTYWVLGDDCPPDLPREKTRGYQLYQSRTAVWAVRGFRAGDGNGRRIDFPH